MTTSTDPKPRTQSSSRRALLAGALGGLGAWAASAIGRASPARAGSDGDVVLGASNNAATITTIDNTTNANTTFKVTNTGGGSAIAADSAGSAGVFSTSVASVGVYGGSTNDVGVWGFTSSGLKPAIGGQAGGNNTGVFGLSGASAATTKPKTGVYGYANQDAAAKGVWGYSGKGAGLYGQSGKFGIALRANGRIKADKVSGVATINAGNISVTVSPGVNVTTGSFVLLTPQANIGSRGLWYTTNPTADTITIHLSASRSSATKIAWLLLG